MIAAVFDAGGADAAARHFERLVRAAGREPSAQLCTGDAVLGAWWPARLDAGVACEVGGGAFLELASAGGLKLTRGPVGGRALYWARQGRAVVACSRLGPLRDALDERTPDLVQLAKTAFDCSDATPYTVYGRIRRVLSREVLVAGPVTESTSIQPIARAFALEPLEADADTLAVRLREELHEAVARAMDGHERVAVFAGGGLDSSAVLAAALAVARRKGRPHVDAYALDYASEGDDRPHLRALAEALGIEPVRVPPRECAARMREGLVADAAPYVWPTAAWQLTLMAMARERGATAVISGVGGDQILDGDPRAFGWSVLRGDLGAALEAARLVVPWRSTPLERVREYVLRPIAVELAPAFVRRSWRAHRATLELPPWAGPVMREAIAARDFRATPAAEPSPAEQFEACSTAPGILQLADVRAQAEAAGRITVLEPLLDPAFVALVVRMPPRAMLHGGRIRGLFRHAMRGALPESVRLRPDKAAFEPALDEMLASLGGLRAFADLASMEALGAAGIVEPAGFQRDFDEFARGRREDWLTIWPALATEAFARGNLRL